MNPCPTCFRPLATEADEALAPPEGSHLCWKEWGGVCEPPEWWSSVTPLEVQRLREAQNDLGNRLYSAIVERLAPHYPASSRDLEWDVLPGTLTLLVEERDELRLALAAEQGKPEGAPSEGWSFETMCLRDFWTKTYEDGSVATVQGDGSWMRGAFGSGSPAARGKADHQRAAMIAADKATSHETRK